MAGCEVAALSCAFTSNGPIIVTTMATSITANHFSLNMVLSSFVMKRFQNPLPPIPELFAAHTERAGDLPAHESLLAVLALDSYVNM